MINQFNLIFIEFQCEILYNNSTIQKRSDSMKKLQLYNFKNNILTCILLSVITGVFTGILIFLFRISASFIMNLSGKMYDFVRTHTIYLPLLLAFMVLLAFISILCIKYLGNCKGGGIPTSIAILRGLIEFRFLRNIFAVWFSALVSYLGGVPLGNEGPSVQMGTAAGRATVKLFCKSKTAWDRYIMTGGASAGFAVATASPLTGIFFAFEDAHRRFSPLIFMSAACSVISGSATMNLLCRLTNTDPAFFHFTLEEILPLEYIWSAIIIGIVCGFFALIFTKFYKVIGNFINDKLKNIPLTVKIPIVFILVAIIGFLSAECIGSGHSVVDIMILGDGIWYLSIIILLVRAIMLIVANTAGLTGGLFVPTLALGSILGSLTAKALISFGVLPQKYYPIMVVIGIASFLSSSSRTPISAIAFSVEALSGLSNILPIALSVATAYIVIETAGTISFTESVVETKLMAERSGKTAEILDTHFVVKSDAFVVGKEIRDILWPPACVVTSLRKSENSHSGFIAEGDILHLHCKTYDFNDTVSKLEALLGVQNVDFKDALHSVSTKHDVPEI